jgi:hypothetical protein
MYIIISPFIGIATLMKSSELVELLKLFLVMPNVAIERQSKWAKPACEGPSRMACWTKPLSRRKKKRLTFKL